MQIMVCGPVGGIGTNRITEMMKFLEDNGFQPVRQIVKGKLDYSTIKDFRKRKNLANKIITHDLQLIKKSDVLIVLPEPSFGASIEMYVAKSLKKKIILFSNKPIPSPWPVRFSDIMITNKKDLINHLQKISRSHK